MSNRYVRPRGQTVKRQERMWRMQLDGQAAIVTGGGSGLGAATASLLAAAGCKLALFDINEAVAAAHATTIGGLAIRCDVFAAASAEAAMAAAPAAHSPPPQPVDCARHCIPGPGRGQDWATER